MLLKCCHKKVSLFLVTDTKASDEHKYKYLTFVFSLEYLLYMGAVMSGVKENYYWFGFLFRFI